MHKWIIVNFKWKINLTDGICTIRNMFRKNIKIFVPDHDWNSAADKDLNSNGNIDPRKCKMMVSHKEWIEHAFLTSRNFNKLFTKNIKMMAKNKEILAILSMEKKENEFNCVTTRLNNSYHFLTSSIFIMRNISWYITNKVSKVSQINYDLYTELVDTILNFINAFKHSTHHAYGAHLGMYLLNDQRYQYRVIIHRLLKTLTLINTSISSMYNCSNETKFFAFRLESKLQETQQIAVFKNDALALALSDQDSKKFKMTPILLDYINSMLSVEKSRCNFDSVSYPIEAPNMNTNISLKSFTNCLFEELDCRLIQFIINCASIVNTDCNDDINCDLDKDKVATAAVCQTNTVNSN